MSFVKKVKRKVKDSLHIPSRNRSPGSRSSPGPADRTPTQLSAASSSVSVITPANTAVDSSTHVSVPHNSSTRASHISTSDANPSVAPAQVVDAIPVVTVTEERTGGNPSWTGLKGFLALLDRSADVFGPIRSAVDGVMACVEIYERVGQGREEYESLRQELNSLFEELSQYFDGSTSPSITSSFYNLAKAIEKEMKVVEEKGQRSVIERVAEARGDRDEVLECYRRVERLLQRMAINANVRAWKVVDEQMTEHRLKSLSPSLSAKYSSAEAKTVGRAGCTPNTRIDVLKGLGDWAHGKDSEKIYWLNGMAGIGKTTIAYTLCDQLHTESKLAASFFCSRQLPECRNASLIFPTIAYQLARFSLPFRFSLSHAIERDPDVCAQQLGVQFQTLIFGPLRAAKDGLPDDLVVTIDALDECENPDSVGQILDVLFPNALDLPVKFLITSRPEPQIRRRMLSRRGERTRFELHLHDLDRSLVKEDIKTYLGDELKEMKLASTDLERFADRSGALFIYAATLVRYLSFENFARGPDRLQLVLGAAVLSSEPIKKTRDGTPGSSSEEEVDVTGRSEAEVIALYTAILKAAMEDPRLEKREKVERRRVLHTVVCAQEPLTVSAIAGLMGLSSSDSVQRALQPLLSVIRISEDSGVVTTLHESFPNYLCNKHRSGEFHCDTAKHNGWLANRCFAVMKMPDPPFNCHLESSYVFDEEVENLEERIEGSISRELVYACRYWGAHLVVGEVSKRLVEGLSEFLETRFLLWMEVMNLKHSLSLGAGTLRNIQTWCKKAECSVEARELVVDGWDFVTMYSSSPIARSTPHIYVSALPFWSKQRPIAKRYTGQMRGLIGIGGTALGLRTCTLLATCKNKTPVLAVAYSPDGTRIASGSKGGVHVWDAYTGQIIHQALGNDTWATRSVAYSPDGARIASGSDGGIVDLWDARTGQRIGEPLRGHSHPVYSVVYSPDGTRIASGSGDKTVRIWDAHTGQSIGEPLRGHTGFVRSVAYSPDGACVVSGSDDHTLRIWDARTGHMKGEPLQGHTGVVWSVAYSPNGTRIVSGSYDKSLRIWDALTGQSIGKPFHGHTGVVRSVTYSPHGSRIVSGSYDHMVRIWDAHTGQTIGEPLRRHTHFLSSVAYSPDGARIVSGAHDCTLQIWGAHTQENTRAASMGHSDGIESVRYSPDGTRILSFSLDKTLRIWDAHTGQMIGDPLVGHGHEIESADYSPNGAHIVSGSTDGSIRIWDAHTGQTVGEPWAGHTARVVFVAYLPGGNRIISCSRDNTVRIWEAVTGRSKGEPIRQWNGYIKSATCSPDGARIIFNPFSSYDLHFRDAHTGNIIAEPLRGHTNIVTSVVYSPDGAQIVTGSGDNTARIWNAHTGRVIGRPFQGHTDTVHSVSYSPDGARIVTASADMTLRIWEAHTGQSIGEPLRGHTHVVGSVAYSPDGSRIVSGSWDDSVRIWDAYSQGPHAVGHHIHPSNTWSMDETGWVVDEKSNPLIWVPYDLQGVVLRHPNVAIISRRGSLCIDLGQARVGELWRSCYEASPSSGFS